MSDEVLDRLKARTEQDQKDAVLWADIALEVFERTDATIIVDERGNIFRVNLAAELIFGYSRRDLLGQPIEILVPSASRKEHVSLRAGFAEDPRQRSMGQGRIVKGQRKDGTEFAAEISLSPIPTERGLFTITTIRRTHNA